MTKKKKTIDDTVRILHKRYIGDDARRMEALEKERESADIAEQIYRHRRQAGLSQKELAKRVGTTQSVISRLEDADYGGHSLAMLRKIASAMNQRVSIRFIPDNSNYAVG